MYKIQRVGTDGKEDFLSTDELTYGEAVEGIRRIYDKYSNASSMLDFTYSREEVIVENLRNHKRIIYRIAEV